MEATLVDLQIGKFAAKRYGVNYDYLSRMFDLSISGTEQMQRMSIVIDLFQEM